MKVLNMKHITLFVVALALTVTHAFAGEKLKGGINWLTWDEVQVEMKKKPKKVFVDIYTNWCGWCKVMDKKTFSNPEVIKYMNENFYAVKFDAETREDIMFMGKKYSFAPEHNANLLAAQLMNGQMSYPTTIIMDENFANPQPVPGYIEVPQLEMILTYLGTGTYKTKKFDEYSKTFTPKWQVAESGNARPQGH